MNKIKEKEKKEKILKLLNDSLNKHNNIINELIKNKEYNFEEQLKISELIKLNDYLYKYNKLLKEKNETLEITKVYYDLENKIDFIVKNSNDNIIYENSKLNGEFYLPSNSPNYKIIDRDNNQINDNIKLNANKISLKSFEFLEDKEKIFDQFYSDINEENITLIFGDEFTSDEFYDKFPLYKNKLKELEDIFTSILNKKDLISNCKLDKLNKKNINQFSNLCNVKFNDNTKCEKINESLKNIKKNLEQINNDYNFISDFF